MARMFHEHEDENGVAISSNCHPASEFGPPAADQRPGWPHMMISGSTGPYIDPPAQDLVHKQKDRVLMRLGRPGVGMCFDGDLLPRSERMPKEK